MLDDNELDSDSDYEETDEVRKIDEKVIYGSDSEESYFDEYQETM